MLKYNVNKFIDLLMYGSINDISTFVNDYKLKKEIDIIYYVIKFVDNVKRIKKILRELDLDITDKKYRKYGGEYNILDLAYFWGVNLDVIEFLKDECGLKSSLENRNTLFFRKKIFKNNKEYEKFLNLFKDLLEKNLNFYNFRDIIGVEIEGEDGKMYCPIKFLLTNGNMDGKIRDDFRLGKILILLDKYVSDYIKVLDFILQNYDNIGDKEKINKVINRIKDLGISYNYNLYKGV